MGEIRDAIETIADLKTEFKTELTNAGVYSSKRSISASALEGTANFSVLVEDTISLDDGILITRALEKKYASFLLTCLTMDPYLEVEKGTTPSAAEYVKKFHQNMRVKDKGINAHISLVDFLKESYEGSCPDYSVMESEAFKMAHAIYEGVCRSVPQDKNILLNYTVEEVTNPEILNSKFSTDVLEAKKGKVNNTYNTYNTYDHPNFDRVDVANANMTTDDANVRFARHIDAQDLNIVNNNNIRPNINNNIRPGNTNVTVSPNINVATAKSTPAPKSNVRDRGLQWKPLTDNDCKKANDLVPTLLHVRIYPVDKYTKDELTPIDFLMGVKATMHPIPVKELARMVVSGMRNENFVFNFIRWTTGEIKFFKDFVFAIDTLKIDAKDSGRDVTGWRPALKRRRNMSRAKLRLTKQDIMPNATLVVSQGAVDYIKENFGYDLDDERIVRRMMNVYFLLGYVSVNTVNQRASFLFDGIETADTYTFDTLKRESQSDDKAFKNMMKMLGRSM